ncbi:FIMAH domain-containing protein [Micromonospora purpureochromogenes]|uniref:FIMAH domain-containing protein n=1 Tax=Micromonospora purpureochromogenes TaxID=47872 RepID=UPI003F4D5328
MAVSTYRRRPHRGDRHVRTGRVHRARGGNELRKRLREVEERIADGEPDKAREKLREFAEKLVSLRREDKLSARGYDVLVAGATQLAQALPAR